MEQLKDMLNETNNNIELGIESKVKQFIQDDILDNNDNVDLLYVSICEHMRWNSAHMVLGYAPMSLELFKNKYQYTIENKKKSLTADEIKKLQVCLTDWDKLIDVDDACRNEGDIKQTYECYDTLVVITSLKIIFGDMR